MNQQSVGSLRPSSIPPAARAWAWESRAARVLHVFQSCCNLIDDQGRILSLVSKEIGDGPFSVVLPAIECDFRDLIDYTCAVIVDAGRLSLSRLAIDLRFAPVWSPRPDWAALHSSRDLIRQRLLRWIYPARAFESRPARSNGAWQERFDQASLSASRDLAAALKCADRSRVSGAAERLAGLGEGLTPAGDDILMGAIYAAWILHGPQRTQELGRAIVAAASSRTTSLSLAWLCAAARGEASIRWHHFLHSLLQEDHRAFEISASAILVTGHTSGMAAMEGFLAVLLPGLWKWPAIGASVPLEIDSLAGVVPLN